MKIKVAVVVTDSNGEGDIVKYDVICTQDEYDLGLHYDFAKEKAEEFGYEVKYSFDENEPAYKKLKD
jgi:hypothetical protein